MAKKPSMFPDLLQARVECGLPKAVDEAARRQRTTRAESLSCAYGSGCGLNGWPCGAW